MLTGIAILIQGPGRNFAGAGVFVLVVVLLIVALFMRMYVWGGQSRQASHRSRRRQTAHHDTHAHHDSHAHHDGHDKGHST